MVQEFVSKLYKQFVRLAFNVTIIVLIIGLFVGIFRTISELGLTVTEATVRLGFKELVTNVLSLIIVLELIRAFIEFFEHERIRMDILLEVLVAFVIREFMLHLFEGKLSGMEVFFWSLGIVSLIGARTISFFRWASKV
ncbi:phosphate-starvation-inducible PsiE family protein [Thermocrinis jamiesonii]|jgi:Phosphate-starvation-inducible E.|uniref:phosphate-starvation-inducible PsiE family protein n=1 Tax=Thermocrinis jamiesonii TaxID=1302351 RepID=UPI0004983922